jgi:hypothetical protein
MASTDGDKDRGAVADGPKPATRRKRERFADDSGKDVGTALRIAYRTTVEETVPAEMLDLLGKLN